MTITFHAAAGLAIAFGVFASASANDIAAQRGAALAASLGCADCAPALLQPASFAPEQAGAAGIVRQLAEKARSEDDFVTALSAVGARPPKPFAPGQAILSETEIRALYRYLSSHPGAL